MTDQNDVHPARATLAAYGLGKLEPGTAASIEAHIAECDACCETLLDLQSDTFVDLVRRADAVYLELEAGAIQASGATSAFPHMAPAATFDLPQELIEHPRYRMLELLGRGGMGDVYKAEHRLMNRPVALKVINQKLVQNPQAVERFRREVQAAAQLSHPNIVTAHDAEQAGNVHYLVMEYVEGADLSGVVKELGALPVATACDYVRQAALGLQHAYEKGMVHRDIKPHNLMVTRGGQVKILDFGLATLATLATDDFSEIDGATSADDNPGSTPSPRLTTIGAMMGTPDFISPEQAADAHAADARSDIYSLGCTFYYLLTGRPPFDQGTATDKIQAHAKRNPRPIEAMRIDVPSEVADVVRRMMAKDPAQRFQRPSEVADALAPFVDRHRTDAAASKPIDLAEATYTSTRRGWPVAAIALAVCALIFAAIYYVVTDHGTLVIESVDDSVEVMITRPESDTHKGMEVRVVDRVTGSQVVRLPSGHYRLIPSDNNDHIDLQSLQFSKDQFVLKRGDKVIVRVMRRPDRDAVDKAEPVVGPETRGELRAFVQAARPALSDDELRNIVAKHAPVLSVLEADAARALAGLLAGLPDALHETLLQKAYLKWRFESLDAGRQTALNIFLEHLLSPAVEMGFPEGIAESGSDLLAAGDVGFAILTNPETKTQFVTWYLLMPDVPVPMLFPLTGASAQDDDMIAKRAVHDQLFALLEKPYSDMPEITNSLGMTLQLIPAGTFEMGTAEADVGRLMPDDDWFFARFVPSRRRTETPQHRVTLTMPFYMAAHEVTVGQFRQFISATGCRTTAEREGSGYGWRNGVWQIAREFNWANPGFEQRDDHPVCNVSWGDAVAFCRWLSEVESATYRLPTEAEWEYACRAGTTTLFSTGDEPDSLRGAANLTDASLRRAEPSVEWAVDWEDGYVATAPVGSFDTNAFGLFDMHGNAWEWCQDVYDRDFYTRPPETNPVNRGTNGPHVFRGGGFDNWPGFLRSADRYSSHSPTLRTEWAGFRVVREIEAKGADELTEAPRPARRPPNDSWAD